MTSAAIYLHTYHHLSPEFVAEFGEPNAVPLDVKERACRAYCERMGYAVFGVYRATTMPPDNVKSALRVHLAPGPIKAFYGHDSRHPYYLVRDLLAEGTIDVIVEFTETGPSRSAWARAGEDLASRLPRIELASLWEVEPPTERQRRMQELVRQIGEAETDEEGRQLLAELSALAQAEEAEREQALARPSEASEANAETDPARTLVVTTASGRMALVTYRPRAGQETQLAALVGEYVAALRQAGLATARPPVAMRAVGGTLVVAFEWASAEAVGRADGDEDVRAVRARLDEVGEQGPLARLPEVRTLAPTFTPLDL